jgi:hypothetical protein
MTRSRDLSGLSNDRASRFYSFSPILWDGLDPTMKEREVYGEVEEQYRLIDVREMRRLRTRIEGMKKRGHADNPGFKCKSTLQFNS